MSPGELNEVSLAIGELRGAVRQVAADIASLREEMRVAHAQPCPSFREHVARHKEHERSNNWTVALLGVVFAAISVAVSVYYKGK